MKATKPFMASIAIVSMLAGSAADAKTIKSGTMTFEAAPCAAACAYLVDVSWAADDLERVDPKAAKTVRETSPRACEKPFPAGSYDDVVLTAPTGARTLQVRAYPSLDWDTFLCAKPATGNNGAQLASGLNPFIGWEDGLPVVRCLTGCIEDMTIGVVPGRRYVVRAYNFADSADLIARYWFRD